MEEQSRNNSVQFSHSVVSHSLWPHESQHARPPCPSPTPGFHSGSRPLSHLILCCPLLLLTPIPPSIRVFSNESTLRMRWPKYESFSFSIILSKEIPGLIISFSMWWKGLFTTLFCYGLPFGLMDSNAPCFLGNLLSLVFWSLSEEATL